MHRRKTIWFESWMTRDAWITHRCDVICPTKNKNKLWIDPRERDCTHRMLCVCVRWTDEKLFSDRRIKNHRIRHEPKEEEKKKFINWCVAGRFGNFYKVWPLKTILVSLVSISDTVYMGCSQRTAHGSSCESSYFYRFASCTSSHLKRQFGKHLHAANIQMSLLVSRCASFPFLCAQRVSECSAVRYSATSSSEHCPLLPITYDVCASTEIQNWEKTTNDIRTNTTYPNTTYLFPNQI